LLLWRGFIARAFGGGVHSIMRSSDIVDVTASRGQLRPSCASVTTTAGGVIGGEHRRGQANR